MLIASDHMAEISKKMPQASLYQNDFQSWGKPPGKLVFGRPEEKYYPMKFTGKVASSKTIDNDKTQHILQK